MKVFSLLYHDVVDPGEPDASGFAGGAAARYKLGPREFDEHLKAIGVARTDPPARVTQLDSRTPRPPWLLTFDDGGASARWTGERLAELGWPAHFFVTAERIGSRTFVGADDVRALASLGHVIGSHSYSHPDDMASRSEAELLNEWTRSADVLAAILGAPVRVASVPAGSYAPQVARAAAAAGITALFNSEPEARMHGVDGCTVLGRYTIRRGTGARTAARIAAGAATPRARQLAAWRVKRVVRSAVGPAYERARRRLFG